MIGPDPRYTQFAAGFFDRFDTEEDTRFYHQARLVTHIDERAITAVGRLYDRLGLEGRVLDLMSSWISHFETTPESLVALGMNRRELAANPQASGAVVADLNRSPVLPFAAAAFDAVTCCVSVDYLVHPLEVFDEVARVLRPGGVFCCTFSNRCFPTKAINGWLSTDSRGHVAIVGRYFALTGPWAEPQAGLVTPPGTPGDPLHAVWAARRSATGS
jgi:SAM-dependent methyltransferase